MTTRYTSDFGAFEISPVPGQAQIGHCHGFFIVPEFCRKGLGTQLKKEQMGVLFNELYDYATCTVAATNTAQKRILRKAGWTPLSIFDNRRTDGQTELWGWAVSGNPTVLPMAFAMQRMVALEESLRDLLATIELHTDCMDGRIDSEPLVDDIEKAEHLLAACWEADEGHPANRTSALMSDLQGGVHG